MGQPLSLFADYSASENLTTNHCGLILKLLYQDNPIAFSKALSDICGETVNVGVQFSQQRVGPQSVPDLVVNQDAIEIVFETKLDESFRSEQLAAHLTSFTTVQGRRVLVGLSKFEGDNYREKFLSDHTDVLSQAKAEGIIVTAISYEDFHAHLAAAEASVQFKELLEEFASFLDRADLLPTWRHRLDVVNCRGSLEEFQNGMYVCPHGPSFYNHRRARFMGAYADKAVRSVAEVRGVVRLEPGDSGGSLLSNWKEGATTDLVAEARAMVSQMSELHRDELRSKPLQVFLLGPRFSTEFKKESPGGMFSSKQYFDVEAKTIEELAQELRTKKWKRDA